MREHVYKQGFAGYNFWSKELPSLIEDLKQNAKGFGIAKLIPNIDVKDSARVGFQRNNYLYSFSNLITSLSETDTI